MYIKNRTSYTNLKAVQRPWVWFCTFGEELDQVEARSTWVLQLVAGNVSRFNFVYAGSNLSSAKKSRTPLDILD
jgi:hypothetical protein